MQKTAFCNRPAWRGHRNLIEKAMKITVDLLTMVILHVSATGISQTISFTGNNVPLEKVFAVIEKQTNYTFFYKSGLLEKGSPVSVDLKGVPLTRALELCFRNQPFTYSVSGRIITIEMRKPAPPPAAALSGDELSPPTRSILGIVTDENDAPMAGVTVIVKGSDRGTQTDGRGLFVLRNLKESDVLVLSAIGYETQTVPLKPDDNFLTLKMKLATNPLDKVVIQAYGTTSQRLTTGSIVKVTSEEIEKQPVMNPLLALDGRVPGLVVTPTSGFASGRVKMEIRGRSSINPAFTSDPLYIIDGVPLTVLDVSGQSSYQSGSSGFLQSGLPFSPAGGQSPFFSMNPADIESIEVLKDADATAIYGSRGANGVILITTKKGKAGDAKFNLSVNQGMSKVTRHWAMLDIHQYLEMRREAFRNDGITPTMANAPDLLLWDTTRNVDWQKELWEGTGRETNIQGALSGGDAHTQFRIGANYERQTEILNYSGANQRGGLSFNLTNHSNNQRLMVSLTANYSYALVNSINVSSTGAVLPPDAPPIFDSKGDLNYAPWDSAGLGGSYPFASLLSPYTASTHFLTGNLTAEYSLFKGLKLRTSLGYNNAVTYNSTLEPIVAQDPLQNPLGYAMFGNTRNNNWIFEPQLTYTALVGGGKLNVLAGGSSQNTLTDGIMQYGLGYTNDAFIRSIANAPLIITGENYGQYKYAAVFGRINYDWRDKYILNLNARRDGSSRFGPGRQFGNFGSAGAAWIVSEEDWVRRTLPSWFSFLKLRSSYGLTGSDGVWDYQYLSQWNNTVAGGNPMPAYAGITPLINQHAVNQDYHWQTTKKLEGAVDLGFGKDSRLNLEIAYYRTRCDDQLTSFPTPVFSGFAAVTANSPANVQNVGWEFRLDASPVKRKNFSWTVNANLAINRNKLLSYPNLENSPYATTYKVGQPLNNVYLLHYTGVDPLTGQYSYQDLNHDGNISVIGVFPPGTQSDDRGVAIDLSPRFTGGIGNQFSYRRCTLSFFLNFCKQKAQNAYNLSWVPGSMYNQPLTLFNGRWQKPGDKAQFAKLSTVATAGTVDFQSSDGNYTDASYLRLNNLYFSYSLPEKTVKKAGMQGCNLFISAQNILVITRYKGIDPQTNTFGTLPPAKIFNGGISFNF